VFLWEILPGESKEIVIIDVIIIIEATQNTGVGPRGN
jgi:hypothetical protein